MVTRWELYDPVVPETYVFPLNPRTMDNIHVERNITGGTTTAVNGLTLVTEGNVQPLPWGFNGRTYDAAHYAALLAWKNKPYRVRVTDHFGRSFWIAPRGFDTTAITRMNVYWAHEYRFSGLILTVPTAPTVGV